MAQIVTTISNTTGVPTEEVRHILDEFIERTGIASGLEADVLDDIQPQNSPDQSTLAIFDEEVAAA